ncbi:MAG: alcohol dehydrogenase catalytic domain-containing protein [Microthrixaceae bacterium]
MQAWEVTDPAPIDEGPLRLTEREAPQPADDEVIVEVSTCGVCRTDLHLAEGDLAPHMARATPGHEVVGTVVERGATAKRFAVGDRVGIAAAPHLWQLPVLSPRGREPLHRPALHGLGRPRWLRPLRRDRRELRLPDARFVRRRTRRTAALCRNRRVPLLKRASVAPGGRLGIYGFGASAHLVAQVAVAAGIEVYVCTRAPAGAPWHSNWAAVGRRSGRTAAGATRRSGPVRPSGRTGASGTRGTRPRWSPVDRWYPPERRSGAQLPATPVPGARGRQRHRQHPCRWRGVPGGGIQHRDQGRDDSYGFERADAALADLAHDRVVGAAVLRMSD